MKTYLILAASALAMAATPALAATAAGNESTINIGATVAAACGVGNHRSGASSDPAGDQTDASITLADPTGQYKTATTVRRSFGNVWCNAPATVTIAATPLQNGAVTTYDASSFTNRFDLSVAGGNRGGAFVYVGGGSVTTAIGGSASKSATLPGAFETGLGDFSSVDITVLPSLGSGSQPLRPVAGSYSGSVTFTATVS